MSHSKLIRQHRDRERARMCRAALEGDDKAMLNAAYKLRHLHKRVIERSEEARRRFGGSARMPVSLPHWARDE
jgi:hypothetical protein